MAPDGGDTSRPVAARAPEGGDTSRSVATAVPVPTTADEPAAETEPRIPARRSRRRFSPITLRILAVNILALAILVAGLLYLGQYQRSLIQTAIEGLKTQGELIAGAIAEGAVSKDPRVERALEKVIAQQLVRRLTAPGRVRARLFDPIGKLVADSRQLAGASRAVFVEDLPPPVDDGPVGRLFSDLYDWTIGLVARDEGLPLYLETPVPLARDYHEVVSALAGNLSTAVRQRPDGEMVLSIAIPVQRYKRVLGALMLTMSSREIEKNVRAVRIDILKVFAVALTITVILSIYLAGTIAHPIRRLAAAADKMKRIKGRQVAIPDFTAREDEVGDLSGALRDMTEALWQRMDAIEGFAADVAHEIKNPLSSLRSAVETAARVSDPEQQRQLMAIILEDVQRLDRLITDISHASRLDAELSRVPAERVDIAAMLHTLANIEAQTATQPPVDFDIGPGALMVDAEEGQLVQVFRNLIDNARSFSPADGRVTVTAHQRAGMVCVEVIDDGPGIPDGKEDAIFTRFYSERPEGEKFGTHSGLGLSISRQIVEAHGGTLEAENRRRDSVIIGACFRVALPAV